MAIIELNLAISYDLNFQELLNSYHIDLLTHPDIILELELSKQQEILSEFLVLACQCSHHRNIQLGRDGVWALPRKWVLDNIEKLAEPMLQKHDEYEYRRLLEVYWHLDKTLARKFANYCLENPDIEIRSLGEECIDKLNDPSSNLKIDYWE